MVSQLEKFGLLFKKNLLLQRGRVAGTVLEVVIISLFIVILIIYRLLLTGEDIPLPPYITRCDPLFCYPSFSPAQTPLLDGYSDGYGNLLFYAPHTDVARSIMQDLSARLCQSRPYDPPLTLLGFENEQDAVHEWQVKQEHYTSMLALVVLDEKSLQSLATNDFKQGQVLSYKIRQSGRFRTLSNFNRYGIPEYLYSATGNSSYMKKSGFLWLQQNLDLVLIERVVNSVNQTDVTEDVKAVDVYLNRMPYPEVTVAASIYYSIFLLPMFITFTFLLEIAYMTKHIAIEKEIGMKEFMKVMGVSKWLHLSSWFLYLVIYMVVINGILVFLLCTRFTDDGAILQHSDAVLVFLILFIYGLAAVTFCFFVSSFCNTSSQATLAAMIIWMLGMTPYFLLWVSLTSLNFTVKMVLQVLATSAGSQALAIITQLEAVGVGAQFKNFHVPISKDNDITLAHCTVMLGFATCMHLILAVYLEQVRPGPSGIARPWYFPFLPSSWGYQSTEDNTNKNKAEKAFLLLGQNDRFEDEPSDCTAGVEVRQLTKNYISGGRTVTALNRLNMKMVEGQITALLGHNGAGKSTLIGIITGLISPSSGTASVCGHDVTLEIDQVQKQLGLCCQHDILFDSLTVKEHLEMFGRIKGLKNVELRDEVNHWLEAVKLEDKAGVRSCNLSGGMKRRLCLGIAMIGSSPVVILDEPTSGLDPSSRRLVWEILVRECHAGRTILLTTQHMDEADALGDRIAILVDGQLQCMGSSPFLKKYYGCAGYRLVISGSDDRWKVADIRETVMRILPEALYVDDVSLNELVYQLPEQDTEDFGDLFKELEKNKLRFGIASMRINLTTVEEVFVRASEEAQGKRRGGKTIAVPIADQLGMSGCNVNSIPQKVRKSIHASHMDIYLQSLQKPKFKRNSPTVIKFQQMGALLIRNALLTYRRLGTTLLQIFLAVFIICVTAFLLRTTEFKNIFNAEVEKVLTAREFEHLEITIYECEDSRTFWNITDGSIKGFKDHLSMLGYFKEKSNKLKLIRLKVENELANSHLPFLERPNYTKLDLLHDNARSILDIALCQPSTSLSAGGIMNMTNFTALSCLPPQTGRGKINVTAIFNAQALHGSAVSINFADNFLMWYFARKAGVSDIPLIETINHPLSKADTGTHTSHMMEGDMRFETIAGEEYITAARFIYYICNNLLFFAFMLVVTSFTMLSIQERATRNRHLMWISGANPTIMWMSLLLYSQIMAMLVIAPLSLFAFHWMVYNEFMGTYSVIFVILLCGYTWSQVPLNAIMTNLCFAPDSALSWNACINFFLAFTLTLVIFLLKEFIKDYDMANIVMYVFLLYPNFAFADSLYQLQFNYFLHNECSFHDLTRCTNLTSINCSTEEMFFCTDYHCCSNITADAEFKYFGDRQEDPLSLVLPGVLLHIIYLYSTGLFNWLCLCILCNENLKVLLRYIMAPLTHYFKRKKHIQFVSKEEDEDVRKEKSNAAAATTAKDGSKLSTAVLLVHNLTKSFGAFLAVDDLSFMVQPGDCFGLLGINGAGKTTTFKMLTGAIRATAGKIFIGGVSMIEETAIARKKCGYCPQQDALIPNLSGEETLWLFARLHGIPERHIGGVVQYLLLLLNLYKHRKKQVYQYSGGTKRKLSTAISLLGKPKVVFLDEPSTGMDPVSQRYMWKVLKQLQLTGISIVLTSHSMLECEALCSRIAIMVNGQFRCLGSAARLKENYGQGFTVTLRLSQWAQDKCISQKGRIASRRSPKPQSMLPSPTGELVTSSPVSIGSLARPLTPPEGNLLNPPTAGNSLAMPVLESIATRPSTGIDRSRQTLHFPPRSDAKDEENKTVVNGSGISALNKAASTLSKVGGSINDYMRCSIRKCELLAVHQDKLTYYIPTSDPAITHSLIFNVLNEAKRSYNVKYYRVHQTSLEDVFLDFAKQQHARQGKAEPN